MSESMKPVDKKDRKLALVIVDVQKKFIIGADDSTLESAKLHTETMKKVIDMFREAGRPVIWILYEGPTCMEGITDDAMQLLDGFEIKDSDFVVRKYHMNSFNNTNLSDVILKNDCDAALIMGMFAQHCVVATNWGAFDKEVSPYMMRDGLISNKEDMIELVYGLCKTYDLQELEENLEIHKKK
ncbi:MAG: cysteine hydrolase [Thermoplasmata archaeon]|nr:cysteine hydrolase [Thermoplasmata archaeon]